MLEAIISSARLAGTDVIYLSIYLSIFSSSLFSFGCRREFDWLICIALLSCSGHICIFGLLPWLVHMRVFAGQCCDVRVLHPSSIAATFCLICSMGSARACPGSTCIRPVWLRGWVGSPCFPIVPGAPRVRMMSGCLSLLVQMQSLSLSLSCPATRFKYTFPATPC